VAARPLPDRYVRFDRDIQGPRGRFGRWSFAGNGRNYGVGYQGKDTFVGGMITQPAGRRQVPLNAALQAVTTEVRLNHTENHWDGGRCCSARERLTTTLGPDFGALAVRYAVSRPQWHYKNDEFLPWEGTQTWYLSASRLVGLLSLEATADEKRAAVHGRVRLGMKRPLEKADAKTWKYGRLRVAIHEHNYATVEARPSETTRQEQPGSYRSAEITLLDPLSVAAGQKGEVLFKKGTRYWFLVEVRPEDSPPAEAVARTDEGSLVGFRFREAGREVLVFHNPTTRPIDVRKPLDLPVGTILTLYSDNEGKGTTSAGRTLEARLEPGRHVVARTGPG
jgi:hypothetical protein